MPDSNAKREWIRNNTTCFTVKLNIRTDADIIAHLGGVDNRVGYIKRLIREDITRSQKPEK
jgi:hypothetical protein